MMKKVCSKAVVFAVALCMAASVSVFAAMKEGEMMGHGKMGCPKMGGPKMGLEEKVMKKARIMLEHKKDLALTEEQVEKIEDIKTEVKKELIKRDADIEVLGVDVDSALRQESIDVGAVNALIDKKYELKKARAKYLVGALADIKAVLSKKQMSQLKELYGKYREENKSGKSKQMKMKKGMK